MAVEFFFMTKSPRQNMPDGCVQNVTRRSYLKMQGFKINFRYSYIFGRLLYSCSYGWIVLKLKVSCIAFEPRHEKPAMPYANNKGADQPAHPCSLIIAFVVRCLYSTITILAISSFKTLASLCS